MTTTARIQRKIERRFTVRPVEVRETPGRGPMICGYAAVWDTPSVDFGGFVETIARDAFTRTLADKSIRRHAFWNHETRLVLGSEANGSLVLRQDNVGLWYECWPQPTSYANDLLLLLKSGDVCKSSFGFTMSKNQYRWEDSPGVVKRVVVDPDLFEVSVVTEPAYPDTEAMARFLADVRSRSGPVSRSMLAMRRRALAVRHRSFFV
jgi:HK97 family phage prohead protease